MKYKITPIDPLISRDARPFGAGGRVRSLDWLTQTAAAGAVRTALWKDLEDRDSDESLKALRSVKIRGPFPMLEGRLYFPRPLDIAVSVKIVRDEKDPQKVKEKVTSVWQIKPITIPEGCHVEMPPETPNLRPCSPFTSDGEDDFKPEKLKPFWARELMDKWLETGIKDFPLYEKVKGKDGKDILKEKDTLSAPARDERSHVSIDPATGTSKDGMLFSTTGLDFVRGNVKKGQPLHQSHAVIDVEVPGDKGLPSLPERFIAPLGGERRLAEFRKDDGDKGLWPCPPSMEFHRGDKVRLVLASPAIFTHGWLPGWIDKPSLEGTVPGTEARFKLISAVTGRWQPISGWSYEKGKNAGPKPTQRMVPAGSVYFMELLSEAFNPASLWLSSVCDDQQASNDGFGLALWGRGEW